MAGAEILIVGGTGRIGSELVKLLAAAKVAVRVLDRSAAAQAAFSDSHIETVVGDLNDPAAVQTALRDISSIFVVLRDQPEQVNLERNLIEAP